MPVQIPVCNTSIRQLSTRHTCPVQSYRAPSLDVQAGMPSCSGRSISQHYTQVLACVPLRAQRRNLSCQGSARVYSAGEIVEVEGLQGIRVVPRENERPMVEYLVKWKDGSPDTWEPATNLADNLLRDFEQQWWGAVKKGDEEVIGKMLAGGGEVLARTLDENRRSALHFAAALGKADLVQRLVHEGADVDLGDKEGYTPLHMAAGYLHTTTVTALIQAGADPEQQDAAGRSPMGLVESLKERIPANNPALVGRRIALEEVIKTLTDNLYEDVEPAAVVESRVNEEDGGVKEYLVRWQDGREESWVAEKYLSEEVVEDFSSGLEYAEAECVLDVKVRGDARTYRVRWQDDYPDSWEPEENVSLDLIALFEQQQALMGSNQQQQQNGSVSSNGGSPDQRQQQQQQQQVNGSTPEGRLVQAASN